MAGGHSSLVDLGDFVFFLDYPVPLRVPRQHMLRSTPHSPPHLVREEEKD